MNAAVFQKASRKQLKLKLALTGPAGSGKTFSALEIASGMGGKIALIDTENRSASIYSDRFSFDVMELEPPFSVDRYVTAMRAAVDAGYDVLIVDSASHQWAGEGGILDKKNKLDKRGGNSFTNWADLTPEHNTFMEFILRAPVHMIVTLRSKVEYVVEQNERGKSAPRKVGMAPITREGSDFEFTTVLDMDSAHQAASSKDRTNLFDGQIFKPTKETGRQLIAWLNSGAAPKPTPPSPAPTPPQSPQEQGAAAFPSDDIAWPVNPENGDDGMKDEEWTAVVDEALNIKTKGQLQTWWKQVGEMFSKVWTEAQKAKLVAFKDELKARVS